MRAAIIIPTYNERDNISSIITAILQCAPQVSILVVDDNSPDGTGTIVDTISAQDNRVYCMHRPGKQGLGTAYIQGFKFAMERGFDLIFEMDADFSHDPAYLPRFLEAAENADLVVGSRYIPGGSTPNWSMLRRFVSGGGNLFARLMLQLPVHDCTSGYRCYRRTTLEALKLDDINCQGYAFQVEMVYQVLMRRLQVTEIPITFVDRRIGKSKMSRGIFLEAFLYVLNVRRRSGKAPRSSAERVRVLPPIPIKAHS